LASACSLRAKAEEFNGTARDMGKDEKSLRKILSRSILGKREFRLVRSQTGKPAEFTFLSLPREFSYA
jgi:hypothetical protein